MAFQCFRAHSQPRGVHPARRGYQARTQVSAGPVGGLLQRQGPRRSLRRDPRHVGQGLEEPAQPAGGGAELRVQDQQHPRQAAGELLRLRQRAPRCLLGLPLPRHHGPPPGAVLPRRPHAGQAAGQEGHRGHEHLQEEHVPGRGPHPVLRAGGESGQQVAPELHQGLQGRDGRARGRGRVHRAAAPLAQRLLRRHHLRPHPLPAHVQERAQRAAHVLLPHPAAVQHLLRHPVLVLARGLLAHHGHHHEPGRQQQRRPDQGPDQAVVAVREHGDPDVQHGPAADLPRLPAPAIHSGPR